MVPDSPLDERLQAAWTRRRGALRKGAETRVAELRDVMSELGSVVDDLQPEGAPGTRARALHLRAHVASDLGALDEAQRMWEESTGLLRSEGNDVALAHGLRHLGDVLREKGAFSEARARYDEAWALYDGSDRVSEGDSANLIRGIAVLEEEVGNDVRAGELWREARTLYARLGVDAGVEEADRHLERLIGRAD